MCGIGGIWASGNRFDLETLIREMMELVVHRGPDGEGYVVEDGLALGHRRLSIIDLSTNASQPMRGSRRKTTIIFNGEIYNYLELREVLRRHGKRFTTESDTEVLLKAYEVWGTDCVHHLVGMWSFAIHDKINNILFCSRDRFGEKPFYYTEQPGFFAFGSEIRQLLPLLPSSCCDQDSLLGYIAHRVAEPIASTFFSRVAKLPAGHSLVLNLDTGEKRISRYYTIKRHKGVSRLSPAQAVEQFAELFRNSVALRLRSDVPVGTCLSGGLDSSAIAALAAKLYNGSANNKFSAITGISEDPSLDESDYARQVVEKSGLNWITVKPTFEEFRDSLDDLARCEEEPFASASAMMGYSVMRAARQSSLKVLLDGQGADEILLGYHRYASDIAVNQALTGKIGQLLKFTTGKMFSSGFAQFGRDLASFHLHTLRRWQIGRQTAFLKPVYRSKVGTDPIAKRPIAGLWAMQEYEIEAYCLPPLLRYEDKQSMWHSVETRLPFLDHALVEFCLSLNVDMKLRNGYTKSVMRSALQTELPDEVTWRKSKLGFAAPESLWLSKLAPDIADAISSSKLLAEISSAGSLNASSCGQLMPGIRWRLFSVALWERNFSVGNLN